MEDNNKDNDFARQIKEKETRKVKARNRGNRSIWLGIGMFGIIGWSIAIPTLLGAALGMWLDKNYPGKMSYTLSLLIAGLVLGCFNAWFWVSKEDRQIHEDLNEKRNHSDDKKDST